MALKDMFLDNHRASRSETLEDQM